MARRTRRQRHHIKHHVKEWREYRDMSQDDVAALLEVDQPTVSRIERRQSAIDPYIDELANIFRCSPEELLHRNPKDEDDTVWAIHARLVRSTPMERRRFLGILEALSRDGA